MFRRIGQVVQSFKITETSKHHPITRDNMSKLDRILDRVTVDPRVCLGQPTVRGMRITISVILKMVAAGKSVQEIIDAYPELEPEDVQQSLQYAAWVVSDQLHISQTA
jgi:uncharacterized protein (DUF433 family)